MIINFAVKNAPVGAEAWQLKLLASPYYEWVGSYLPLATVLAVELDGWALTPVDGVFTVTANTTSITGQGIASKSYSYKLKQMSAGSTVTLDMAAVAEGVAEGKVSWGLIAAAIVAGVILAMTGKKKR